MDRNSVNETIRTDSLAIELVRLAEKKETELEEVSEDVSETVPEPSNGREMMIYKQGQLTAYQALAHQLGMVSDEIDREEIIEDTASVFDGGMSEGL